MLPNTNHDALSISSVLACCGLFAAAGFAYSRLRQSMASSVYATYAEKNDIVANLDSEYDSKIAELYQKADYSRCIFAEYNPSIEDEDKVFNQYQFFDRQFIGTMLQRNARLLSKLFVKNISSQTNGQVFTEKEKIKILDVGCGIALSLPGIKACRDEEKIDYLGVDIDPSMINQNKIIYRNYSNTKFITEDAVKTLTSLENKHKFDVILVQHPNFSTPQFKDVFKNIFNHITDALAPGGVVYITFYYEQEVNYFEKYVLPTLSTQLPFNHIVKNTNYNKPLVHNTIKGLERYSPEQFSLRSFPKPGLTDTYHVARFG